MMRNFRYIDTMRKRIRNIHFVGIGGIGMSGIAEVLLNLGYTVSGSDLAETEITKKLEELGARIGTPHRAENIGNADVLVVSTAIAPNNPEVLIAQAKGIPVIPRAEMLAELLKMKLSVAVSGSHGKTTTTSMIATTLAEGGFDPTLVVGGKLSCFGSNAHIGEGEIIVAEADESDRSFLKLNPILAVITNIDLEHLEHYRDIEDIKDAFAEFANKVPFYGTVFLFIGDKNVEAILPCLKRRVITCDLTAKADYWATAIQESGYGSTFSLYRREEPLGEFSISVPGKFNVQNALLAIAVALELEMPLEKVRKAIKGFEGVQRRLEVKGIFKGIRIVDDYGHHPTEIKNTLQVARSLWGKGKLLTVFQPHRYTRTKGLFTEFLHCFDASDEIIVMDIYAASEKPIAGVSARKLVTELKKSGFAKASYMGNPDIIVEYLQKSLKSGDTLITQGAGDVYKIGEKLRAKLLAMEMGRRQCQDVDLTR